jgi:NADPH2:quinone reductase
MRRLEADRFGAPTQVLRLVDTVEPTAGPGQLLLHSEAVGLNFLDVMLCRGDYPGQDTPPIVPGVEVVGRVMEAAPGTGFTAGQRVLSCPAMPSGALGERVVVDAAVTVPAPDRLDPLHLAALPVNYQTAWFALDRAAVRHGETVLIHAGAGGVGIAATQLALARGARVIAVAGGARKTQLCRAQGAVAVDHEHEDFVQVVHDVTDGQGVDVVIDPVGGGVQARSWACLAFEGRLVVVGAAGGPPPPVDPMSLTAANVSVIGLSWGSTYPWRRPEAVRDVYARLFGMLGDEVRPVLDRVVGLEQAAVALTDLANRRTIGKIVVTPNGMPERNDDVNQMTAASMAREST